MIHLYISGRYTGSSSAERDLNIERAAWTAARLWDMGFAVLCPHMNTARFEERCKVAKYDDFLRADLELLSRLDAVVMLPGWEESKGACAERERAIEYGLPVYEWPNVPTPDEVAEALNEQW